MVLITMERQDGLVITRKYSEEFFKLSEEEIGANILDFYSQLQDGGDFRTGTDYEPNIEQSIEPLDEFGSDMVSGSPEEPLTEEEQEFALK